MIRSVIVGTGSHIPSVVVPNDAFLQHEFRGADHKRIPKSNAEILKQFEAITGIRERRYVPDDVVTSDIAFDAASQAPDSSAIARQTPDYILRPTPIRPAHTHTVVGAPPRHVYH